ncbi:methyl-accepting chemotaxis protein [Pseudomonadota bacterium]
MKFFQNLKLSQKFLLLIVVLLIGFGVIGLVYNSVLDTEKVALARAQQVNKLGGLVDKIEINVLNASGFEKDFQLSNKLEFLERFDNTMTTARQDVEELGTLLKEGEEKNLLTQLQTVLESYQTNFYTLAEDTVAVGLDENSGVQGEVDDAASELEESLQRASQPDLSVSLLRMRRHEKNFISHGTEEYLELIAGESAAFTRGLKEANLDNELQTEIQDLLTAYEERFQELVDSVSQRNQQIKIVNATIAEMSPTLDAMLEVRDQRRADNINISESERTANTALFLATLAIGAGVISLLVFLLSRGITQSITRPIEHLQSVVNQIAAGDFDVRAKLDTEDELGNLGSALDNLLDERVARLQEAERENELLNESVIGLLTGVAQLSQRDLTVKVPVTEDVTGPVGDAINLLVGETAAVLEGVRKVSNQVAASSKAVKSHSDIVVTVAKNERETVDATAEELVNAAKTMNQINQLAQTSNETADKAIKATMAALETVTSTVNGIDDIRETIRETEKRTKRLGERTQEITGTVNLINNIAERTHILALNASMHAASAGEAGRGFAVVADEVQRLAENAREATSQISSLVGNIQMETGDTLSAMNKAISQVVEGTRMAQQAGTQMQETQRSTADLVQSVQHIAKSSREQVDITNNLLKRASQIQQGTQQTRKSLDDQSKQTQQLLNFSKQLLGAVGVFKLPSQKETPPVKEATPIKEAVTVVEVTPVAKASN